MKIIKGEFDRYISADGVISKATMEAMASAERILDDFEDYSRAKRADLDHLIEAEKQKGYNDGFAVAVAELSQSMMAYNAAKAEIVDHTLPLVHQCLQYVFSRLENADVLSALIVEASGRLKLSEPFKIRLHPNLHDQVHNRLTTVIEQMGEVPPHLSRWEINSDASMDEKSCELVFQDQIIFVSQEVAIDGLMKFIDLYYEPPVETAS